MTELEIDPNYRRVTEVIKPFTGIEFIPSYVLEPAAKRGTMIHQNIEDILKGDTFTLYPFEIQNYISAFNQFWDHKHLDYIDCKLDVEKRLYDDELMLTGCLDLVVNKKDRCIVYDWKTSSRPSKSWRLQAAAYRYLLEKNGYNVEQVYFIHLKKTGKHSEIFYTTYEQDLEVFKKCVNIFDWFDMKKTRVQNFKN